ncbi:MAG: c-type cytochrome [Silvibacterium sp.]|nr:c-type cytochrome [Silvibacterium sp.]MBV8436746.1 c-type cytochrome [Silvibacterium sp.]
MKVQGLAGTALLLLLAGCNQMPGAPKPGPEVPRPESVTDFATLYGENCAGCHGRDGQNGAAYDLANPVYQSWVDDAAIHKIISGGESGTQMPAFGLAAGGFLTDAQIDALVHGMRTAWRKPDSLSGEKPPSYAATAAGDPSHGQATYQAACARCHEQANSKVTDPTYLALVNDQTLRTIIVAGRPDVAHPNWQGDVAGHPLTEQEIADLVAWLGSQRSPTPGQPYAH